MSVFAELVEQYLPPREEPEEQRDGYVRKPLTVRVSRRNMARVLDGARVRVS